MARINERTYEGGADAASVRALLRAIRDAVPGAVAEGAGPPLEATRGPAGPPRLAPASLLESGEFARSVNGDAPATFAGFLDGVQQSHVAKWLPSGAPIVVASVGAVILARIDRRLVTWRGGARVRRVVLAPRAMVDDAWWSALAERVPVVDIAAEAGALHPESLIANAIAAVDALRGAEERALAESWARGESSPLCADGPLWPLGEAARSPHVIGVVKSHRTLHVDPAALPALFALPVGSRTRVTSLDDGKLWTWYLRLRDASAADPMHGLVRIEIAAREGTPPTAYADEASGWVLADRTPIALPDARWDVMPYGIARCEAYLKSGLGLRNFG